MGTGTGVLREVQEEARRAHDKHGKDSFILPGVRSDHERLEMLVEEVGEVARAMSRDEGDRDHMREELIQVAHLAVAWCAAIDYEQ